MKIQKKCLQSIAMVIVVVIVMAGFGGWVKHEIKERRDDVRLKKMITADGKNIKSQIMYSDCSGWYSSGRYQAQNNLRMMSEIENIVDEKSYQDFEDNSINFYLPKNWEVKVENDENGKMYRIKYCENSYFSISLKKSNNFIDDYSMCISRCFNDAKTSDLFSWKSLYCSEDYSEKALNMMKSGNYINYLSTGSLPPGGAGLFIYTKIVDGYTVSLSHSSEDNYFYPKAKEIMKNKTWKNLNEDEMKIVINEREYYREEFYKILKTVSIK